MAKSKFIKKTLSFALTLLLLLQMPAVIPTFAAPDAFVRVVEIGGGAIPEVSPDGQAAFRTNYNDGSRITSDPIGGDWSNCLGMYLVFDAYAAGVTLPASGDFAITHTGISTGWWGQGAHFFTATRGAADASGWVTYSVPITQAGARTNGQNPVDVPDLLANIRQLGLNMGNGNFLIKNMRFQSTTYSAKPVPSLVSASGSTANVKAAAPTNDQAVEFAVSATSAAPAAGWVTGTLSGSEYTAALTIPAGAENNYFVFARAKRDALYAFDGVSSRLNITSVSDADLVEQAKAALNWNAIRNANPAGAQQDVKTNLALPATVGTTGVNITWASNQTATVTNAGVVNRLNNRAADKTVTLTATLTRGAASDTWTIDVVVKAAPAAANALPFTNLSNVSNFTLPDGNSAVRINRTWTQNENVCHIIDNPPSADLIAYADQYFVFDMYVNDASLLNWGGNAWFVIHTEGGGDWNNNSRVNLNRTGLTGAQPNTWITVSAQLSASNAVAGNFTPALLGGVVRMGLHFDFATTPPASAYMYIKNPRFQNTAVSPKPVPAVTGETSTAISVSAPGNTNNQSVQFAASADDTVPAAGWTDGTPVGGNYTATLTKPAGVTYFYVFARTVSSTAYPFAGTAARIPAGSMSDEDAVNGAKDLLTWDTIKNANIGESSVLTDLTLPAVGANDTEIEWSALPSEIIDTLTGAVTRPVDDTAVTLTAAITKGAASDTKVFNLTVIGTGTLTDQEAVDDMLAKLTWDVIKGVNALQTNVTSDLVLPRTGDNMTAVSWASNTAARITISNLNSSFSTGSIPTTRADAGGNVTVTATVSRNGVSGTKQFVLTLPDRYDFEKYMRTAIEQENDAKDYAITDFNVLAFGAKTEEMLTAEGKNISDFCNRTAFQSAIDAAYNNGGGVVYAPAGVYPFHTAESVQTNVSGEVQVPLTSTTLTGVSSSYIYQRVLNLRMGVTIRGEWDNPDAPGYDGKIDGTILAIYAGKGSDNYHTYAREFGREAQANDAKGTNVSDRFIDMERGTGVSNLSIWYPEQDISVTTEVSVRNNNGAIEWTRVGTTGYNWQLTGKKETVQGIPFPWVFVQRSGNSATIDNVTLVNAWSGFIANPAEMHYVVNTKMTALYKGVVVHTCTDIGRIENVDISPSYWANSGLPGAPSYEQIRAFTRANARGFQMHRSDWEYIAGLNVTGYKEGMWLGREIIGNSPPNGHIYNVHIDDCESGIYFDRVSGAGLLISDSLFSSDRAVYFNSAFDTIVQFNGVKFNGPVVSEGSGGVISFEDCVFDKNGAEYALSFNNRGNTLVSQCNFLQEDKHVNLAAGFGSFKALNSGYNLDIDSANLASHIESLVLDVIGGGASTVKQIVNEVDYIFEPLPKNVKTDIDVHPRPASKAVLRVDLPRSLTSTAPSTNISANLQSALDFIKTNYGGGTVYLPGGRYRLDAPVTVPEGVELRGSWDVQHHTEGGGTAIFTNWNGVNATTTTSDENGTPLIRLGKNAGVRGLNITQSQLAGANFGSSVPADTGTVIRKYPFLIQGQGTGVYAVNLTIPIADKGLDFATYDSSGHYVDYLGGTVIRAGIWVGGGAKGGFIRNMQFNPHYALRLPPAQGYTAPSGSSLYNTIQSYSSALKFADVEDQTIFNNFVFGSVYGVHFLKDSVTGKYPGEITMVGHGSDGCTYALYVEDGDENTKIISINGQLVNTGITSQPDRAYVRMGSPGDQTSASPKVDPKARLVLYNTAFWGSPTTAGAVTYNGITRLQQANFNQLGGNDTPGIYVIGGDAHVYTSYFQPTKSATGTANGRHAVLLATGGSIELSNNHYNNSLNTRNLKTGNGQFDIYGADLLAEPFVFGMDGTGNNKTFSFKYNIGGKVSAPGVVKLVEPSVYAADFTPVRFGALAAGESVTVDLPKYAAGLLKFEIALDNGRTYSYTGKYDVAYADPAVAGTAGNSELPPYIMDTRDYVRPNTGPVKWDSAADLSAETRFSWDNSNLYLYVVVTDKEHFNAQTSAANIWNGDCLQVGIDMSGPSPMPQSTFNEVGFALNNSGAILRNAWTRPTGTNAPPAAITAMTVNIVRDETAKTTTYDLIIPFNTVANAATVTAALARGTIGVSIFINDADSEVGRRQEMEVVSSHLKTSLSFTELYLLSDAAAYDQLLETSASEAVAKAILSKADTDLDMALNLIELVKNPIAKAALIKELDVIKPIEFICNVKTIALNVGTPKTITYDYSGPDSERPVFASSNPGICAVEEDGMLIPKKAGMAIITVKCNGVTKVIVVTVK